MSRWKTFWCELAPPVEGLDRGHSRLHRRVDTGAAFLLSQAPVGAMWDAAWMAHGDLRTGLDGITLVVRTPGGDWLVDSECNNCTRTQWAPKEIDGVLYEKVWSGRTHYCWCRHGDPRTGLITVNKIPEPGTETCSAGGGSIQAGNFHGMLEGGELYVC